MTRDDTWKRITTMPQEVLVETCVMEETGVTKKKNLIKRGNLLWTGKGENDTYIDYSPTHWRRLRT